MTALSDLKAQLNLTDEGDDELLTRYVAAAEKFTANFVGGETPVTYSSAPADLCQAVLLLAAHWYENREATLVGVSAHELPLGFHELANAHREWVF